MTIPKPNMNYRRQCVSFGINPKAGYNYGILEIAFSQDRWAPYSGPGFWNDPNMLVVGHVGWVSKLHATQLTPDEQDSHVSIWCTPKVLKLTIQPHGKMSQVNSAE
jgi:hypothetical protein